MLTGDHQQEYPLGGHGQKMNIISYIDIHGQADIWVSGLRDWRVRRLVGSIFPYSWTLGGIHKNATGCSTTTKQTFNNKP